MPGRSQVCKRLGFIACAWRVDSGAGGENDAQAFIVEEEEGLVAVYRSTDRSRPLVHVVKGLLGPGLVVEEVVRIHHAAVPPVRCVSVELVRSRAADFIDLCAAQTTERSRIG